MGYGIEAAVSAKLDNENLNSLIRDEEFSKKFEEYLEFLRDHSIELPKKINKPDFFSFLSYLGSFINQPNSYDSIKEHILYEDYYIDNPLTAFEFLVTMAYLSTEKPDSIIKVGIGDSSVFWLDIEFKNGILNSINRSYFDMEKMEDVKIGDDIPFVDAFTCSEEEMRDFFSISIKKRLKKLSAPDLFSEFDIDTDKIDLSNKNLKVIGESILKFKNLKELNLSGNRFKKIPKDILKLKGLVKLNLCNNQLSEICEGLSALRNLEVIDLSNNNIQEIPVDFCNLEQLKDLEIDSNNLQTLPYNFGNLKNLERFWVSDNDLEKFPDSICNLTNLKILGFIRNRNFSELPENLGDLTQLNELRIEHLKIQHLPKSFYKLDKLKKLDFHCNPLEGFPEVLTQMKHVETLKIGSHAVIKSIPESISQMEDLKRLDLSNCKELELLPESIGKLKNLEELNISDTRIRKLPDSIGELKKLKKLNLEETHITKLPDSLKDFDDLEVVSDKGRFIINESDQLSLFEGRGKEVDNFNQEISNEKAFFENLFNKGNLFKFCSKELRSNKEFVKKFLLKAERSTSYNGLALEFMDDSLKADLEFAKELILVEKSGSNIRFFNEEIRSNKELVKFAVLGDDEILSEASNINFASDKLKNDESFLLELFDKNKGVFEFFPTNLKNNKKYAITAVIARPYIFENLSDNLKKDEDIILALLKDSWFGNRYIPEIYKKNRLFIIKGIVVYDLNRLSGEITKLYKDDKLITTLLTLEKKDKIEHLKTYIKDHNLDLDLDEISN